MFILKTSAPSLVGWRETLLAFKGHEEYLALNPLLYGQPMEVLKESAAAIEVTQPSTNEHASSHNFHLWLALKAPPHPLGASLRESLRS